MYAVHVAFDEGMCMQFMWPLMRACVYTFHVVFDEGMCMHLPCGL